MVSKPTKDNNDIHENINDDNLTSEPLGLFNRNVGSQRNQALGMVENSLKDFILENIRENYHFRLNQFGKASTCLAADFK